MKAFTERNPRVIGSLVLALATLVVCGVLFLNRSFFSSGYTLHARFTSSAGIAKGAPVLVAGVQEGTVSAVHLDGDSVVADLSVDNGVVLPHETSAAIEVETLLGVLDVTLEPHGGWSRPLRDGSVITDTSVPVEFQDLENTTGNLLEKSDVAAFDQLLKSLDTVTQGKQAEVSAIVSGLDRFTGAVDQRQQQVSSLIDSADQVAGTVAARDQQLGSLVDNLATVVQGLASHSSELSALIAGTEQVAAQTASLVGDNQPELQGLIAHLGSVLAVVQQHQDDLAQAVSYLDSAITGFQSIAYAGPNDTPVPWANEYANLVGLGQGYNVLGGCGVLDQALDEILGPDPTPCDQRTGPPVSSSSSTPSGGPSSQASGSASASSGGAQGASSQGAPAQSEGQGSSASNPLSQLLAPLLGGTP